MPSNAKWLVFLYGIVCSVGAFFLFLVIQYRAAVSPLESLTVASLLAAVPAALFAYFSPRLRTWACGLLLSAAFCLYLALAAVALAAQGRPQVWPLVDAAIIAGAACAAAAAARAVGERGSNEPSARRPDLSRAEQDP
jgi:predicted lysophospholipase L1 biosynthesis ABC-type transport system permease subunit